MGRCSYGRCDRPLACIAFGQLQEAEGRCPADEGVAKSAGEEFRLSWAFAVVATVLIIVEISVEELAPFETKYVPRSAADGI